MPVRTRHQTTVPPDEDSEFESDVTVESDYILVFENLTSADLLNGKRITWSIETKTIVLRHAATHRYSAKSLPKAEVLVDLATSVGVTAQLDRQVYAACIKKLVTLVTNLVCEKILRPALLEVPTDAERGRGSAATYDCTWSTFFLVAATTPEFTFADLTRPKWLEDRFKISGQKTEQSYTSIAGRSATALIKQVISMAFDGTGGASSIRRLHKGAIVTVGQRDKALYGELHDAPLRTHSKQSYPSASKPQYPTVVSSVHRPSSGTLFPSAPPVAKAAQEWDGTAAYSTGSADRGIVPVQAALDYVKQSLQMSKIRIPRIVDLALETLNEPEADALAVLQMAHPTIVRFWGRNPAEKFVRQVKDSIDRMDLS